MQFVSVQIFFNSIQCLTKEKRNAYVNILWFKCIIHFQTLLMLPLNTTHYRKQYIFPDSSDEPIIMVLPFCVKMITLNVFLVLVSVRTIRMLKHIMIFFFNYEDYVWTCMFSVPINGAIDIKEKIVKCVHQVHFITFRENTHSISLVEYIYSVN